MSKIGPYISLILRHKPETIGLTLDKHGWADTQELINKINAAGKYHITLEELNQIVETNNKQRYQYNENKSKIRATQGHSIKVDVQLKKAIPPTVLYHGTAETNVKNILKKGLHPNRRLHVHLSTDTETAYNVGKRHGKPTILKIDAKQMVADGVIFYISENKVWLTEEVNPKYITEV